MKKFIKFSLVFMFLFTTFVPDKILGTTNLAKEVGKKKTGYAYQPKAGKVTWDKVK